MKNFTVVMGLVLLSLPTLAGAKAPESKVSNLERLEQLRQAAIERRGEESVKGISSFQESSPKDHPLSADNREIIAKNFHVRLNEESMQLTIDTCHTEKTFFSSEVFDSSSFIIIIEPPSKVTREEAKLVLGVKCIMDNGRLNYEHVGTYDIFGQQQAKGGRKSHLVKDVAGAVFLINKSGISQLKDETTISIVEYVNY